MRLKLLAKQVGGSTSDLFNLPPNTLTPNPENIRLNSEELTAHIRAIADSILASGFLRSRPLTIRQIGDETVVVDGNCRLQAVKLAIQEGAEILTLPCVPEAIGTSEADRTCNMLLANSGLQHSAMEMTAAVTKLLSYGWSEDQVAKRLGRSKQWVTNILDLAGADKIVKEAVANKTISATQALKVVRQEGANAGKTIAAAVTKAKQQGKAKVTAKAFEAPEPKKQTPKQKLSLMTAAKEVLRIWDSGDLGSEFDEAIATMRDLVS